jgi:ATP-dependent helicase/nuclease subunit A
MTESAVLERETYVAPQRTAADPGASAWVAANAGSGKTHVLVERVTRLMLSGAAPERILCLTFTRAAAAEMANRLYERVGTFATLPDDALKAELRELLGRDVEPGELAPARRLFARALDTPGGLKIQTIHAFCQALLARFPLEAGVPPHFELTDERTAGELLESARDRVLERAHADGEGPLAAALDRIVARVDDKTFAAVMQEVARYRGRLGRLLRRFGGTDGLIAAVYRLLGLAIDSTADRIIADACTNGIDVASLRRACAALDTGSDKDRERAVALRAWLDAAPAARAAMFEDKYAPVFLTKEKTPRKESGLITKKAQLADAGALPALLAEQARVQGVVETVARAEVAQSTADLVRFQAALLDAYEEEKAVSARLDYDDLITGARELLTRGAAWVLYKLDGGIDHILIDEAQDTSPEQWEVVAALADEFFAGKGAREDLPGPRTVFVVGDEKQSIFSFQGADVAEFERMERYFGARVAAAGERWRPVPLIVSFRSAPSILHAVDLVFASERARDGVAAEGAEVRHLTTRHGQAGLVEIWPTESPAEKAETRPWDAPLDQLDPDSPKARLADRIAARIARWLADKERLDCRDRPVRPGDILILVRRRDDFFDEMVRRLKVRNVPVAGTDRMTLPEQLAVMDLVALGQFLLLPDDDLILATVLKGPLVGLSEEDLFDLAHGREASLWAALRSRKDDRPAFAAAREELSALLARADFLPPFAFYAWVLGERAGRRKIVSRLGPEANDPIDEFLSLALAFERSHVPSLQGFLHWLAAAPTEVKRDLEQGRDEVRVMTVHGAKGLESPIVFLPDTCAMPDHHQDEQLLWPETKDGPLPLWPAGKAKDDPLVASARVAQREKRAAEYRRLLYVAMTRAADRLYVCGYETARGRTEGCWYDLVDEALSPHLEAVEAEPGVTVRRLANPQAAEPKDKKGPQPPPEAGRPPDWARRPASAEPAARRPLAPSRPPEAEPATLSPLECRADTQEEALARGRIVHRLLELLPEVATERRPELARAYLARSIHGLAPAARREILEETLAVISDPRFGPLFGPGSLAEVPLAGRVGDTVVAGQVDRLLVRADEVLIVDYKTNRPVPETAAEVPAAYLRQMAAYRALLARVYPERAVSCLLLWTVGPRLMALPEAALAPYAP